MIYFIITDIKIKLSFQCLLTESLEERSQLTLSNYYSVIIKIIIKEKNHNERSIE